MILNAIEIKDLTVEYPKGLFRKPGRGVTNLSFPVEKGEMFGFLGPNGAGKTTTIKVLTGLLPPTSGSIKILDGFIEDKGTRKKIGYMPENPYFYEYLTAKETFEFYGSLFNLNKNTSLQKAEELLEKVGLKDVEGVRVGEYSKGMRQRLGFAQALINDPEVIILDEPLSGLDPIGRNDLMGIMLNLHNKGKTIFFSSHILSDIENACTKVGLINEGKLIEIGAMGEILHSGNSSVEIMVKEDDDMASYLEEGTELQKRPGGLNVIIVNNQDSANKVLKKLSEHNVQVVSMISAKKSLERFFIEKIKLRGEE